MTTTMVTFLQGCGNDLAGETKPIPVRRAQRLAQVGYVRIVESEPETATTVAQESADQKRPVARGPKPERRG
jgi:hypothetical protein